ncbi:hypothetical protein GH714_022921 [Hevea brasiliensis]|uniref:Protein kinase domain-containing protein n=1 Tax=Hevea brasiliensis TaxID=3981 RepID=A0A6A6KQV7_HEVBR|nr:hypothetical protein GH714_022921 [Hevea brasiliensis]
MKMHELGQEDMMVSGGRTVMVGVKLDSQSRELLTWAMVKVAQPGDTVIALHVLGNNEIVDREGKSSLLSLVKTFDSVLAVYEGFCNLKQVDLKLKICRGTEDDRRNGLLNVIQRSISLSKNSKVLNESGTDEALKYDEGNNQILERALVMARPNSLGSIMKRSCSICGKVAKSLDDSCKLSVEESSGDNGCDDKSLALVPVPKVEARSCSISSLIRQVPELKPGWPLLCRAFLPDRQSSDGSSVRQISVVQWAMRDIDNFHLLPTILKVKIYQKNWRVFMRSTLQLADCLITKNFSQPHLISWLKIWLGKEAAVRFIKVASLMAGTRCENLEAIRRCNRKDPLAFGWSERYKVAVGVEEALENLHSEYAQPVIHRDVKSSNILLSDDFEPQLSDFGLAKWAPTSSSHIICTDVAGTFGYLAPEYFMYGKVNNKIDVYAYGVVLLELLSGRKPISNDLPKGQESLVIWAKPILNNGKVSQLLDPSLGDDYDHDQMERMVLAATLCVKRSPRARPQMNLSHLNLALLDVEDDSLSMSSIEQTISLENYLQGRPHPDAHNSIQSPRLTHRKPFDDDLPRRLTDYIQESRPDLRTPPRVLPDRFPARLYPPANVDPDSYRRLLDNQPLSPMKVRRELEGSSRGKHQNLYPNHEIGEQVREGSPVELDVSFKSNSLVAKAIVMPPSSFAGVSDLHLTPRNEKERKALVLTKDTSSSSVIKPNEGTVKLDNAVSVANNASSPDINQQQSKVEVTASGGTDVVSGKTSSLKVAKKKKIVKRAINPNLSSSSSQPSNKCDESVTADGFAHGLPASSEPEKNASTASADIVDSQPCLNETNMVPETQKDRVEGFAMVMVSEDDTN